MTPGPDLADSHWRLGAITAAWARLPMEQALEGVAETGVRYVEFASIPGYVDHFLPEHVRSGQVDEIRSVLDRLGLAATSMSPGADLTTPEGTSYLAECIEAASALGITYINNGSGSDGSEEDNERFFANVAGLAELAERHGVTLALETQDGLTADGMALAAAIERIGSPNVRINLDTANMIYWQGRRPEEEIGHIAQYVAHVHMKDHTGGRGEYDFPTAGEGDIDFRSVFAALLDAGFSGPIVLDNEFWREELKTDEERAESLRDPAATYRRPHGYLGTDDLDAIRRGMQESAAYTRALLAELTEAPVR